ncbi:MAG TPA: hypothetical protein PLH27_13150 [bacterium]|nr:hypothetical protein [bacterium]HMY36812.1 hypothetical protein [bacterium]HNB09364.1 hypothetical protein [bacterium]HNB58247.1 hypothetical protein [bacterium]HNC49932.1 hypothetical protein [bacterium]
MKNHTLLIVMIVLMCIACKHTGYLIAADPALKNIEGFWSDTQRKTCWIFEKNGAFQYGRQDSVVHVFMCGQYHISSDELVMTDRLGNRLVYDFFGQADTLWIRSGDEAIRLLRSRPMRIINACPDDQ